LLDVVAREGVTFEERPFTPQEAREAKEAFITGAGAQVTPVISIDGHPIGGGKPGPLAMRLRALYIDASRAA
jgi:D-alanine transaminase